MLSDESRLREMVAAAVQLLRLLLRPQAELLLLEDRSFRHAVFFEFLIVGEHVAALSEGSVADTRTFPGARSEDSAIGSRMATLT